MDASHGYQNVLGPNQFRLIAYLFLKNQVKPITNLAKAAEQFGKGQEINDFKTLIESRDRKNAGFSVPARGLFLTDIDYPKKIFKK